MLSTPVIFQHAMGISVHPQIIFVFIIYKKTFILFMSTLSFFFMSASIVARTWWCQANLAHYWYTRLLIFCVTYNDRIDALAKIQAYLYF